MRSLLPLATVLAVCIVGGDAVTSVVMPPIRATGQEVGLIFLPGAAIKGLAYMKTARAVQEASGMRMWVALTGNFTDDTPNPIQLPWAVEGAIKNLKAAGMKGESYVGVAHSLAGVFLPGYATNSSLKAIVLLGAYITRGTKLRDYPKPVLTLSGELDGQTRITRIASDYEQLIQDSKLSKDALYRTPVINIQGSDHGQFASGPMPPTVVKVDIKPDITEEAAHQMIGKHVSNFVTATLSTQPSDVALAQERLRNAFNDSGNRFLPLLKMKELDSLPDKSMCPWSLVSQSQLAGSFHDRTNPTDTLLAGLPAFLEAKSSLKRVGDHVEVQTATFLDYDPNPFDISLTKESPREIDVKMKSLEAIAQALHTEGFVQIHKDTNGTTCRALNEMAVEMALKASTPESYERYKKRGRPIFFSDDIVYGNGLQWSSTPMKLSEDDQGLHVQSIALVTSVSSWLFPGVHYCKVLSPYRAMEWIHVDGLRTHKN